MDNFWLLIVNNVKQFFTEYGFHDIVLTPYYLYMWAFKWALYLYNIMGQHPFISAVVVLLIVVLRTTFKEADSAENDVLTFVNIHNPKRNYFNWAKYVFWMVFAPFYPLYFWAIKGTMYLLIAYLLPYFLIRRLFDKYYFLREPNRLTAKERHERINS